LSVYNPTGSGNVHTDKVISGGRGQKVAKGMGFKKAAASVAKKSGMPAKQANAVIAAGARNASPTAKKANPALKKVAAKKAPPFKKAMSDAACPPGSMSGGMGTSSGLGAAKKVAAKKAVAKKTPRAKAMGEVGVSTPRGQRNAVAAKARSNKKLPSQLRINPPITASKGSPKTSGSDVI